MAELVVSNLTVAGPERDLVCDASLNVRPGELNVLLGPNGAGKTSLLRAALGLAPAAVGQSEIDGVDVRTLHPDARARLISYLPQARPLAWPNRVRDIVALGRFAHGGSLGRLGLEDHQAIDRALADAGLQALAERRADTLSGGEMARMHFARAAAAQAPLMIADEPVAALDLRHQFQVMTLLRRFVDTGGGALAVLHDVALAARFADRLVWMREGAIVADGSPEDTLTPERLRDVFGVVAQIDKGVPIIAGVA